VSLCSKPGCAGAGAVVLGYDYAERVAILEDPPPGDPNPHVYVLCTECAERLKPPVGWTLDDRRESPPLFASDPRENDGILVVDLPERRDARLAPEEQPERSQMSFGSSA